MQEPQRIRLSKSLSSILRHRAEKMNVPILSSGFIKVSDILSLRNFAGVTTANIIEVVENCPKQRFELKTMDGSIYIRATQGHTIKSIEEAELLIPIVDPSEVPVCVHATYNRFLQIILREGLCRMGRNHIHMVPWSASIAAGGGRSGGVGGYRRDAEALILIDTALAMAGGITFFRSSNGVILSPGLGPRGLLSPDYFREVRLL